MFVILFFSFFRIWFNDFLHELKFCTKLIINKRLHIILFNIYMIFSHKILSFYMYVFFICILVILFTFSMTSYLISTLSSFFFSPPYGSSCSEEPTSDLLSHLTTPYVVSGMKKIFTIYNGYRFIRLFNV